jgi:hypothetical protein
LSRNTANATAISAPKMAPSVPFRALLSSITVSDHSDVSPTPLPVPGSWPATLELRQPCGTSRERLTNGHRRQRTCSLAA